MLSFPRTAVAGGESGIGSEQVGLSSIAHAVGADMKTRLVVVWMALLLCATVAAQQSGGGRGGSPAIPGQNPNGMRVYLRGGLKTHGPGKHDYPQFLADWSKVLTEHGAVVDGSYHAPTAQGAGKDRCRRHL